MADVIHICMISDETFAPHLQTAIASILLSADESDSLFFHVISLGLSEQSKERIERLKKLRRFSWRCLDCDPAEIVEYSSRFKVSAGFYKFRIPKLLPFLDKVLYLDSDILVLKKLTNLWDFPLEGRSIGAARDFIDYTKKADKVSARELSGIGFDLGNSYFNSGVMLMNLEKLRIIDLEAAFLEQYGQKKSVLRYLDQDVFNYLFQQDTTIIPQCWNFQTTFAFLPDKEELKKEGSGIAIVHYTTRYKPWHEETVCIFKEEYRQLAHMVAQLNAL